MAQASLFARWLRTTLALLALMAAGAVALLVVHHRSADVDALFRAMPAETGSAVVLRALDELLELVNRIAASPDAPPELQQQLKQLRTESLSQLGFDATDPQAWKKSGLDLGGPWGMAASGLPGDPFSFIYMPTTDADGAQAVLEKSLRSQGAQLERHDADGVKITRVSWPASAVPVPYTPRAFAEHQGFIVVAASLQPGDAEAALRKQLAGSGLDRSPELKRVRDSVGEPWTAFAYTSPAAAKAQLADDNTKPALPFAQNGFGGAFAITDEKISLRARALGEATQMASIFAAAHPPAERVGGTPLGAARASLALKVLAAELQKTPEGRKQLGDWQRAVAPMDLQRDLIDGLDGQLTAAVLVPKPNDRSPGVLVLAAGARDPKRLLGAMQPAMAKLGFLPDGEWLRGPGTIIGAAPDAVVLVAGSELALTEAQRSISQGGASFAAALPGAAREGFEKGPALWAYLDLDQLARALADKPLGALMPDARLIRGLQAASAGLEVREGITRFDLELFPPPGGFRRALLGAADGGR